MRCLHRSPRPRTPSCAHRATSRARARLGSAAPTAPILGWPLSRPSLGWLLGWPPRVAPQMGPQTAPRMAPRMAPWMTPQVPPRMARRIAPQMAFGWPLFHGPSDGPADGPSRWPLRWPVGSPLRPPLRSPLRSRLHDAAVRSLSPVDRSYAGLKSAVRQLLESRLPPARRTELPAAELRSELAHVAASFQRVAVEHLAQRTARALQWARETAPSLTCLVVAGGVAANLLVRSALDRPVACPRLPPGVLV